jgi:cytochrome P450
MLGFGGRSSMAVDVIGARVSDLDESFDALIGSIPESLVSAPDDFVLDPALSRDPYGILFGVRARAGYVVPGDKNIFSGQLIADLFAHESEGRERYIVLGAEEMDRIALMPTVFVNERAYGSHQESLGRIPTLTDGREHTLLRGLYNQALNHTAMQARAETLVQPVAGFLIERMLAKFKRGEEVDIPRDLALPLTYKAMSTMIGVPQERFAEFVILGEKLFTAPIQPDRGEAASRQLLAFYIEEVGKRRREPRRDMITWLIQAEVEGKRFTDEEVAVHARFLLPAGIETTWRQLALMFVALLSNPREYQAVVDDPSLVPAAIEESFRYLPSGFVVPRICVQTTEVGGVSIPEGAGITELQGIVNRDERRWDNPDVFDVHRTARQHRTFHLGTHVCAGQHLARLEMQTVLNEVVAKCPTLRLACDPGELEIRGLSVRTPMRVPVAV